MLVLARSWIKISQADKNLAKVSVSSIFALLAIGSAMHIVYLLFTYAVCRPLKLSMFDMKAVVITSSQKSMATGALAA